MHKFDYLIKSLKEANEQLKKDAVNPKNAPKERKIKDLQRQIDSGKYKPDSGKIADKIIERELPKEKTKISKNGQWSLSKMSSYGPKGGGQYKPEDNIKRKQTRTSEVREGAGKNQAVRQYTTSGSKMSDYRNQKLIAQNKKQPVKSVTLSPEEKARIEEAANARSKDKKAVSEDGVEKISSYGQGGAGFGVAMSDEDKR